MTRLMGAIFFFLSITTRELTAKTTSFFGFFPKDTNNPSNWDYTPVVGDHIQGESVLTLEKETPEFYFYSGCLEHRGMSVEAVPIHLVIHKEDYEDQLSDEEMEKFTQCCDLITAAHQEEVPNFQKLQSRQEILATSIDACRQKIIEGKNVRAELAGLQLEEEAINTKLIACHKRIADKTSEAETYVATYHGRFKKTLAMVGLEADDIGY